VECEESESKEEDAGTTVVEGVNIFEDLRGVLFLISSLIALIAFSSSTISFASVSRKEKGSVVLLLIFFIQEKCIEQSSKVSLRCLIWIEGDVWYSIV
jgi:hypothetical protein